MLHVDSLGRRVSTLLCSGDKIFNSHQHLAEQRVTVIWCSCPSVCLLLNIETLMEYQLGRIMQWSRGYRNQTESSVLCISFLNELVSC